MELSCFIGDEVFRTEDKLSQYLLGTDVLVGPRSAIFPPTHLEGEIRIGAENTIRASYLRNVKTEEECQIHYAQIFESELSNDVKVENAIMKESNLGAKTYIGPGASLNRVITEERVRIPHVSYLSDLKIGAQTNIAAGVITCNFDGVEKYSSVVGKKCFIGVGVHLIAPCSLEDEVFVSEGVSIFSHTKVKQHSLVTGSGKQYKVHENRCFYLEELGWIITIMSADPKWFQFIQKHIIEWKAVLKNQEPFNIKNGF